MDTVDEIARIVVRSAENKPEGKRTTSTQLEKLLTDRRQQLATWLRKEMAKPESDAVADPLLVTLAGLRRQRLEAEMTSRLLVAYGREFVRPRPYRLIDLADATGMSISGIRTAYGDDEINQVIKTLGRKPPANRHEGYDL